MITFLVVLACLVLAITLFFLTPEFGAKPSGNRLQRIQQSPHFRQGSFHNLEDTPVMLEGTSYTKLFIDQFRKPKTTKPPVVLPSVKTNLKELPEGNPSIVWFGHSSYLVKTQQATLLIDPVLKGDASPIPKSVAPFPGADVYEVNDLPHIDIVLLTHDHYDHLHYASIKKLAASADYFVTSLGVGAHLERWGVQRKKIIELDWWESASPIESLTLTAAPARHFSGRSFKRGLTLWSAFALQVGEHRLFLGGDSGYGKHFTEIGEKLGPFDLAILECGQYGVNWPLIHMMPEQTVQAAQDLKATTLLPVHWAKFELAFHDWNDSIRRVTTAAKNVQPITTPRIGEVVQLKEKYPQEIWWEL